MVANILESALPTCVHEVHSEPESAPSEADDVSTRVLSGFSSHVSQEIKEFADAFVVQDLLNGYHKT